MSDLSRVEQLLRNVLGEDIYEVTPQSRVEALLVELNELIEGMGGSVSPEDIATAVAAYLDEHLTNPTNPPVDTSLSISGAAADAKKTGDELSDLKEDLTAKTVNLLPFKSGATIVNGVQVKNNGAMGLSITGTATSSGGRGSKLSEDITLPAGEYWFYAYGEGSVPSIYLQSAGTILRGITYFDTFLKVSIESESVVYVGINVTSGVQYDATNVFICLSAEEPLLAPHISAVDFVARDNARCIKDISLNSYRSLKEIFPFSVGSAMTTGGGGINYSIRYRITSARKYVADVPLRVYMPTGYKFGVITFPNGELVDSGWRYGEYIIPANMPFYIQLAKNPEVTSDKITNVKDSDLYRALEFSAYTQSLKRQILSLEKLNTNNVWSQGACKVGSTLLGFAASAEDHSTNGNIFRYDLANDFAELPRMYHNLGHASVADYARSTDTAIVGTGAYKSGSQEAIYLIKNMQSKNSDGYSISVSDSDVVELDVSGLDGVSCGACFGETDQIMYLIKVESAMEYDVLIKKYIYKILLGKGSNDLTVSHPTSNVGSYISGCADNEYNGTACVLETYVIDVYGEMQGLKYRNGYLIYATDTSNFDGQKTPYIAKIDPLNETVEYFKLPFYNSTTGAELVAESEGIVIDGVDAYTAIVGSGQYGVFKFSSVF